MLFQIKPVVFWVVLLLSIHVKCFCQVPLNNKNGTNCFNYFEDTATSHSGVNAFLLMLTSHYAYPDRFHLRKKRYYDNPSEYEAAFLKKFTAYGIDSISFFYNKVADIQGIVLSTKKYVILCFRGSDRFGGCKTLKKDWIITDFHIEPMDLVLNEKTMIVHSGFRTTYLESNDDFVKYLVRYGLNPKKSEKKLFITGHSLGAAMSIWAAIDLTQKGFTVNGVYAFASPNIGDSSFIAYYKSLQIPTFCYANRNDPVPMMLSNNWSAHAFRNHLDYNIYYKPGITYQIFKNGEIDANKPPIFPFPNPWRHWMYEYCEAIYNFYIKGRDLEQKMPNTPGKKNKF